METFLGLLRDFVSAALGLAILFGAGFSDDQIGGILLVVTTVAALGAFLWHKHASAAP